MSRSLLTLIFHIALTSGVLFAVIKFFSEYVSNRARNNKDMSKEEIENEYEVIKGAGLDNEVSFKDFEKVYQKDQRGGLIAILKQHNKIAEVKDWVEPESIFNITKKWIPNLEWSIKTEAIEGGHHFYITYKNESHKEGFSRDIFDMGQTKEVWLESFLSKFHSFDYDFGLQIALLKYKDKKYITPIYQDKLTSKLNEVKDFKYVNFADSHVLYGLPHEKKIEYIKTMAVKFGFGRIASKIEADIKRSIRVSLDADVECGLGVSKFGGEPDLPKDFAWPEREKSSYAFIAQLNLKELREYDIEKKLPESGMLYFFIQGGWTKILYLEEAKELVCTALPKSLDDDERYGEAKMKFFNGITISTPEYYKELSDKEQEKYWDLLNLTDNTDWEVDRILGYPTDMQVVGDSIAYAEAGFQGIDLFKKKERYDEMNLAGRDNWELLLQIGRHEELKANWGFDMGFIYFFIRKEDLINKIFSNVIQERDHG